MKHLFLSVSIALTAGWSFAQTDPVNLQKYWKLRNNFRENFVKIGPAPGESLPARALKPLECVDNYYADGTLGNSTPQGNGAHGGIHWGDGMIRHGYYLGLLATEYRLLKDAGQDVTGVLNELFYALNAINRLDINAELEQGAAYDATFAPSLNGFYMREDIPEDFASANWGSAKLEARCVDSPHYKTNNAAHSNEGGQYGLTASGNSYQNAPSSDQFSSLMVGFSLIHKLVDANEFVQPPNSEVGFYIVGETQAIVDRMVNYLNEHNWMMIDVNGWPVNNGGGDVFYAAYPISVAATRITGHDYVADWDRRIPSFFIKDVQYCITGYGLDDATPEGQSEACNNVDDGGDVPVYGGLLGQAYTQLQDGVPAGSQNNQDVSVFQDWLSDGTLNGTYDYTAYLWSSAVNLVLDAKDDRKLSGLPSPLNDMELWGPGNEMNDKSTTIVLTNYGVAAGIWGGTTMQNLSQITGNIQQELINSVIRNENPPRTQSYYKGFIDDMPSTGAYNLFGYSGEASIEKTAENGWGSEHRWTWTSQTNGGDATVGIFNGMDYMLYHNLYYLKFKNNLPPYQPSDDCFCNNAPLSTVIPATTDELNARTNLNNKIALLPYCTENVFTPLNNSVAVVFDVQPFFPSYVDLNIFPTKFQTEDATITGTGDVNIKTRFKICNAKTLTILAGGRMDIEKASVDLNFSAKIDCSGDIFVKSGTTLTIGSQGKLILKPGAKLYIDNDAKVIIDNGAILEYYSGASIVMYGPTSQLVLRSSVKVMDGGEFKLTHWATSAGKLVIDGQVSLLTATANVGTYSLIGKGITDPLIILNPNAKLWAMNDFAKSVTINSCKIVVGTGSSITCEQPFYVGSVDFAAAATNGGLTTTETALINSSTFTNCPVFATMNIENKGDFKAYNSSFVANSPLFNPNDQALVSVTGRGYTFGTCNFSTMKNFGVKSLNMTLASIIGGGTIQYLGTLPAGHVLTGIYDNSNVELSVKSVTITKCNTGIDKRGSGKLTLRCNTFTANREINVVVWHGVTLNMNSALLAGYNTLNKTTNNKNILLSGGNIDIKAGRNFIEYCPNNSTITGLIFGYCTTCPTLDYTKNQWNVANTIPLGLGTVVSSANAVYTVNVSLVALKESCPSSDIPLPGGNPDGKSIEDADGMPIVYAASTKDSMRLDELIYLASSSMSMYNDSTANNLDAIDVLDEVFQTDLDFSDSISNYWSWFALNQMKAAVESAFASEELTISDNATNFDEYVSKYVHALMMMSDSIINENNSGKQFYHEIDKAHLFRVIGHSEIGLNILTELEACGIDSVEQAQLNYWKQEFEKDLVIEAIGFAAMDSIIEIDTSGYLNPALVVNAYSFGAIINSMNDIQYPNCSFFEHRDQQWKTAGGLIVFPNPTSDEVTIRWTAETTVGQTSIVIQQADGRVVLSKKADNAETNSLKVVVSNWKPGVYQVRVTSTNGKQAVGQLVIQ